MVDSASLLPCVLLDRLSYVLLLLEEGTVEVLADWSTSGAPGLALEDAEQHPVPLCVPDSASKD